MNARLSMNARGLFRFDSLGLDHDELAHRTLVDELDPPRNLREKRIVFATPDVEPGLDPRAALPDDDRPAGHQLSAKRLKA